MILKDNTKEWNKQYYPTEEDILSEGWEIFNPVVGECLKLAHSLKIFLGILLKGDVAETKAILCKMAENGDDSPSPDRLKKQIMSMSDEEVAINHTTPTKMYSSLENLEKIGDDHFIYESEKVVYFKKDDYVRVIITNLSNLDDKTWVKFAVGARPEPVVTWTMKSVSAKN